MSPVPSKAAPTPGSVQETVQLAWPTIIGMLSFTAMEVADTYFVGQLGRAELAAIGMATMCVFLINSFAIGLFGSVRIIIAQQDGAGEHSRFGESAGTALVSSLVFGAGLLLLPLLSPWLFSLVGGSSEVQTIAREYFDARMWGAWAFFGMIAMSNVLKGVGKMQIPMRTNLLINALNIVLDPFFIFGWAGLPRMNHLGAAWVTNGVVYLGFFILLWAARKHFTQTWRPHWELFRAMIRYGLPMGVQWSLEALAWTVFMSLMGTVSDAAMAAHTAVMRIISVSFLPGYGLAEAVNVLSGRYAGAGRPELVPKVWRSGLKVGVVAMGLCGVLFFLFPSQLIGLFSDDAEVLAYGVQFLTIAALFQIFDATAIITTNTLNGTGDTRVAMFISLGSAWTIFVPLSWYLVTQTSLGANGAWYALCLHLVVLSAVLSLRILHGGWRGKTLYD